MSKTKKALALEALSSGLSVEKVSEVSHVTRQTVYNWLSQEDFKTDLKEKQREYFSRLSKRMTSLTLKALDVIEECLRSRNESIRLRACGIALSGLNNVVSMTDFEERLSALEKNK
jgi:transposase-like protein